MGWFIWGITFGWLMCAIFFYSQSDHDSAVHSAAVLCIGLGIIALIISINLGIADGSLPVTPTPTPLLGR